MNSYVYDFKDIDKSKFMLGGGKATNLGELAKIEGIQVPEGFCITTESFKRIIEENPAIKSLIHQLSVLKVEEQNKINELSEKIRSIIVKTPIPSDITKEICFFLSQQGENHSYAIRSSATAEDLSTASFAGQQDSYLNIIGKEAILKHISKCWASLFTERAIIYRLQNNFDHRKVLLAVIVQKMVFPQVSGILFTADPVTANRNVSSIDASFGLGEALVSGLVTADNYKVRDREIVHKKIATKSLTISPLKAGGTKKHTVPPEQQTQQALTNDQILQLTDIGEKIEQHFSYPQDIEWCLVDNIFYIVQSRPITTLYPIPKEKDDKKHVYVSVGHQQMMTDPIKPLGLSFYLLTTFAPMCTAGGRLFVNVTQQLASNQSRELLLNTLGKSDPLIKDALITISQRDDVVKLSNDTQEKNIHKNNKSSLPANNQEKIEINSTMVASLIESSESMIQALKQNIQTKSGTALFDFISDDIQQLKNHLFNPQSMAIINNTMNAAAWINENIYNWLGKKSVADILTQSVPNNITSEMGLALLDVADVIRPYPEVIDYLQTVKQGENNFLDRLIKLKGGQKVKEAINAYLNAYGMRCSGEIDITRTRWIEDPAILLPIIINNIKNFKPNASKEIFERGQREALDMEQELINELQRLPKGKEKIKETIERIRLIRNFSGYREYPKYHMINRYFVYKQALLKEAEQLVKTDVIDEKEDIYYLTFEELREVVATSKLHSPTCFTSQQARLATKKMINQRKDKYKLYERLSPPRVMTSDGEIITGEYKRENLPANALAGLPVSSGMIEGRARVILNIKDAILEEGDILVTAFTDPSWTPLFVSIKGLVTEVGGLMTHGAVVAREYGLPAVVGVENATKRITDGQQIRVHGTEGYVEILS